MELMDGLVVGFVSYLGTALLGSLRVVLLDSLVTG